MKITTCLLIAASVFYLAACSDDKTPNAANVEKKENVAGPSISSPSINPDGAQTSNTSSQAVSPATGAGINPEHGQPGHDCALPVGSPLNNSAAQNTGAPQINLAPHPGSTVEPTTAAPAAPATPQPVAAGMNPAHGEPGHDCAIAVGAPLKKKE